MRQTNVRGTLSLRGFRKLRTGAIVATGVILLGLGFLAPTVSANEQDGVWVARTVAEVKADIQHIDNLSHYTIKWGDTLSAISEATGLSVDSLVEINRIANRDLIFANNKLYFSEEAFLKDGNTEVKRQRVSIDNSGSCQSYEIETKTDIVTGEQRTTVKQTTPVVVETPAVSVPKSETSVSVAPKAEEPATPAPKEEKPATPAPKEEKPATPAPKVEEPATPEPKTEEEKLLEETKQDSIRENIDAVVNIKLAEIEKIENSDEKEKLKAKLYELRKNAVDDIKNAKDEEEALILTEKHQNIINSLEISGEKYTKPNFDKDNLSNGRNDGTTIEGGSTAIGHGSGEAPSGATQPASAEGTDNSSAPTAQPQPSSTSEGASSFRNAPSVQARARRVARSTSEPDGTVNISYNFAGMPDIHGFLSDPGENNTVTIPAGTSEAQAKELVKEKIQAKIKDLAARGYHVKNDIIFEQDTTVKNYNYVVTFTKETTGTSGFRMAPAVQPRASRNRRSLEQPAPQKVKVNVFYNFDQMKDIAGFLGDINGTSLEIAEGLSNEQVKAAVKSQVDAKKEELSKRGYTFKEDYVYQANGKDYNYVVTFSKAAK